VFGRSGGRGVAKANCFLKDNLAQGKAEPGATSGTNGRAPAPGAGGAKVWHWPPPSRNGGLCRGW
jgi:hypothetical protein